MCVSGIGLRAAGRSKFCSPQNGLAGKIIQCIWMLICTCKYIYMYIYNIFLSIFYRKINKHLWVFVHEIHVHSWMYVHHYKYMISGLVYTSLILYESEILQYTFMMWWCRIEATESECWVISYRYSKIDIEDSKRVYEDLWAIEEKSGSSLLINSTQEF